MAGILHWAMHRAQGWAIAGGALAWMAGVGLQLQQAALWAEAAYAACVWAALAMAAAAWRWASGRGAMGLIMVAAVLAGLGSTGWRATARLAQRLAPDLEGVDLLLTGRVADMPQVDADGLRFLFVVSDARRDGLPVAVPERLWLGWGRGWQEDSAQAGPPAPLAGGERWQLPVRLRRPHGAMNPEGFDAELWLFEQAVGAVGSVRAVGHLPPVRLAAARAWVPSEALPALRQHWRDAVLLQGTDSRSAGVLAALAVGDQSAIDGPGWELFRQTGVAHLMSISGLHITLFAWLAARAVGALWRRSARLVHRVPTPVAARWGGLALAAAYAALAGWGVPAQRTVGMLALTVLLLSLGLRWPALLVCLVAGAVVSLGDPWALLQPGFWLSFMAVSLLMSSEPVRAMAAPPAPGGAGRWARWRASLRDGLRAQVVATLGLAPLSMVCFQQLSLVGFVANLVAVPVITFLVTPLALAGLLWTPLLQAATWALQPVLWCLLALGKLAWATWPVPAVPAWAGLAALLGAALLVMPLPWGLRLLGPMWMLPLLWPALAKPPPGRFELLAADVGQGSAVLVRTAGHLLVHDAGPQYARDSDAGRRVLLPLLQARGERQIDELVLSHRDTDHVGGAAALLDRLPVRRLRSSLPAAHPLRRPGLPQLDCAAGQAWTWDGVRFEVLHPLPGELASADKPNAVSCVLRVQDALGRSALLTGDIEAPQEAELVHRLGAALRSDVLVVPHHGSHTSSSAAFLAAVAPRWAVIQVGYRSRFGHPHADVLARYAGFGIEVVRTDHCGAWQWDDAGARCTRDVRRRYWHWSTVPALP
jgi:competence protein ComEC